MSLSRCLFGSRASHDVFHTSAEHKSKLEALRWSLTQDAVETRAGVFADVFSTDALINGLDSEMRCFRKGSQLDSPFFRCAMHENQIRNKSQISAYLQHAA